jgi:HSP20 family protein
MTSLLPNLWRDFEEWVGIEKFPGTSQVIRVEDYTEDGHYVLRAELPGMDPAKDVTVKVDNGVLRVDAERREETHDGQRSEFRYGAFHRYVRLPDGIDADKVEASYDKGILTVKVPMATPDAASTRTVPIEIAT